MNAPVILKKYGNRRLYDARRSGYVTLAEVEEMVQRGDDVQVIDAKSGEDITKSVLVQIILEAEGSREALPVAFLKQVVRLGNSPLREGFARALGSFLDGFADMQRQTQQSVMEAQRDLGAQMQKWALGMQPFSLFANPFAAFAPPPPPRAEAPPSAPRDDEELRRLRDELAETQSLVRELLKEQVRAREEAAEAPKPPKRAARKKANGAARPARRSSDP